ncbi:hypothetical protein ACIQWZ_40130 [Streptomyces sp. NPDC098077]|uniref:hypothetical protein n=1 Tax=Streptomyces sp. NPDC098077 TaxID=3366093 RepID=UPI0038045D7A
MTYDFRLHFTQELGNRFGPTTDSWPATAERVTPFLAIVVDALGVDDGLRWFEAARQARQRVLEDALATVAASASPTTSTQRPQRTRTSPCPWRPPSRR